MKTFVAIWAVAMILGFGFVGYHMDPANQTPTSATQATTKASPAAATRSNRGDEAENRRVGCRKLMIAVTESLDAVGRDCPADFIAEVANHENAAKCVTAALVLYNRTRGKRDLEVVAPTAIHDISVACLMMKHGASEEFAEYMIKQKS
jgi:hypothetical protein